MARLSQSDPEGLERVRLREMQVELERRDCLVADQDAGACQRGGIAINLGCGCKEETVDAFAAPLRVVRAE